ncbi:CBS domain-containing protein [Desulfoscipio gibsoniae]|uniref:Putative transcriptional regulator, contains C-terminal CBS domains n=1 Tax=Desulfoscipio gibsoniae DSM 7213 TaxID=767817 RepID=R4KN89_9FIRM|nr:CBS domain-containing protein [Desulfoscipio gibsoniae]AGL03017.1 putative transcriptional regulator, contains C-terminal CBS domains [Desulfoscipio gibsoniae DSM 7213]
MKNPYEKKVQDIMIPMYDYPTVSAKATLKDAVQVLMNAYNPQKNKPRTGRQCVFVVENNEMVGIFGINELLAAIEPHHVKGTIFGGTKGYNVWAMPVFWEGLFTERCAEVTNKQVIEYMRPIESYVDIKDTLLKAAYFMIQNNIDDVAVKDKGRIVGMIRRADLFKEITRLMISDVQMPNTADPNTMPYMGNLAVDTKSM